jgi:hypothetical protein
VRAAQPVNLTRIGRAHHGQQNAVARGRVGRQVGGFEKRALGGAATHEQAGNGGLHRLILERSIAGAGGYKGFEAGQWYGVVAPAATPLDIVRKLNAQINLALSSAELKTRLNSEGAIAAPTTPEAFGQHIVREIARWKPVIGSGRVKAD